MTVKNVLLGIGMGSLLTQVVLRTSSTVYVCRTIPISKALYHWDLTALIRWLIIPGGRQFPRNFKFLQQPFCIHHRTRVNQCKSDPILILTLSRKYDNFSSVSPELTPMHINESENIHLSLPTKYLFNKATHFEPFTFKERKLRKWEILWRKR